MKLLLALAAAGVFCLGLRPAEPVWTVVIGGDSDGHLAPCGCTFPMTGGIRRRSTVVRDHAPTEHRLVLDTGSFVTSVGPQDRFKAEMLAEAAGTMGAVVALTPSEAQFGPGQFAALRALAGDAYVSGNVKGVEGLENVAERGPFAITALATDPEGISGPLAGIPVSREEAIKGLLSKAMVPIVMYAADEDQARDLARSSPKLSLIVHRRGGAPAKEILYEEGVALVSPGERGKYVVMLDRRGAKWENYRAIDLGPEIKDDKLISRMYAAYLQRVEGAGLLDMVPRSEAGAFVGNEACLSCHPKAAAVWKGSKHAHAYESLESEGHDRDPDCVRCHVTGLEAKGGFMSRSATPQFAFVGCESCHGAGGQHVSSPKIPYNRSGPETCARCHTGDNSPRFDYKTYWKKIAH
ncbi:hypothetical protein EON79_07895 [bacterium]|nr:MAG: hypothetical protein EON79_07895 [bacterium]